MAPELCGGAPAGAVDRFKAYNLDAVLDGDLGPVIASAIAMDEAERLSQVGEGSGS